LHLSKTARIIPGQVLLSYIKLVYWIEIREPFVFEDAEISHETALSGAKTSVRVGLINQSDSLRVIQIDT